MANQYLMNINEAVENHEIDMISLENINVSHPKGVITINCGYDYDRKVDLPLSCFNTETLFEYIHKCNGQPKNPKTRKVFDNNEIYRIKQYKICMLNYKDLKKEDILDKEKIITDWIREPGNIVYSDYFKYFIDLEDIIKYFGFSEFNTREKANIYLSKPNNRNWIIRKSSIKNTKYNRFFVVQFKNKENFAFAHIQGYGICPISSLRFVNELYNVKIHYQYYWFSIGEFLIYLRNKDFIHI